MSDSSMRKIDVVSRSALDEAPSVFFVSLPKSGTVYTWYSLEAMTGLKMPQFHELAGWPDYNDGRDFSCPDLYACGDYNTQLLLPQGMKNFVRGHIFGAHMQASYHNMCILKESGIDRISVLLRDPRDAFVSWVHHLNRLGPSARNYHSKIYHIPRDYYDWPLAQQFEYQIRTFLTIAVNWVEGWLDYYASSDREIEVLFVYYDELKRDPLRYIKRITDFHGIEQVDFSKIVIPEPGKMHFRKGEHGQWKEEFSTADQELTDNLMGTRILRGFEVAAAKHPAMIRAQGLLAAGNARDALSEILVALADFPNSRLAYGLVIHAAESLGVDATVLKRLVSSQLNDREIASSFVYRYDLIEECRRLYGELAQRR